MISKEVLISGKSSFKIEVPYQLIETGPKGDKPLFVYLHGYKQNIAGFRKKMNALTDLTGYHLFVQGPYPIYDESRAVSVSKWGRAWYLYDGKQGQFAKSLEVTAEFIQGIVENLFNVIKVNRVIVIGYSMGAYMAGYFALSRWKHVTDVIMIGGRIKTELFRKRLDNTLHINILAIHGKNDAEVLPEPQKHEIEYLREKGLKAEFIEVDAGHELSRKYINAALKWLQNNPD